MPTEEFLEGYNAFRKDKNHVLDANSANPYAHQSKQWKDWRDGWYEAAMDS